MSAVATSAEGWRSKAGWRGKAHYVLATGETACAESMGPRGERMGDLIRCEWKELDSFDHLCGICAKSYPRSCMCGVCRIKATPIRSTAKEGT